VAGRVYLHSGRQRRVRMAASRPDGHGIVFPDQQAITQAVTAAGIGLVVVDPFVKSHTLEENSNAHMDAAATAWAEVAEATGAAILLVHHMRKIGGEETLADIEAARGAKALTDAARVARLLSPMTQQEAEQLGVPAGERWRHVRLDDAKANLAPRADKALWYRMDTVSLNNATALYPHGDNVAAITPWHPRSSFSRLSARDCNRVLDRIALGIADGIPYAAYRRGAGTHRWAGHVLMTLCGLTAAQAHEIIVTWLRNRLLQEVAYHDKDQRKTRMGLAVNDSLRPTDTAPPDP
jgi:hypothetical protein